MVCRVLGRARETKKLNGDFVFIRRAGSTEGWIFSKKRVKKANNSLAIYWQVN